MVGIRACNLVVDKVWADGRRSHATGTIGCNTCINSHFMEWAQANFVFFFPQRPALKECKTQDAQAESEVKRREVLRFEVMG